MRVQLIPEPELQFGTGRHIDIKFGIMNYGPLDFDSPLAPKRIKVGLVGTPETVEGVEQWLRRCEGELAAKPSKQPNLFPRFPGFNSEAAFQASLILEQRLQRTIPQREIDKLTANTDHNQVVIDAVELFVDALEYLGETTNPDVYICAPPASLFEVLDAADELDTGMDEAESETARPQRIDFHNLLKAKAMRLRKPIQFIRPPTYDATKATRARRSSRPSPRLDVPRRLQDEATRAWNFHTALYYKAGGLPWRLIRDPAQLSTCYVGISFYKSLDDATILTSSAQVFNELGEGVIVRGGAAKISKDDRQLHLTSDNARSLLLNALDTYRKEHKTLPARVVLHKTSTYSDEEYAGFGGALGERRVDSADFLSLASSSTRLFRTGEYPPLRGTFLSLSTGTHALYTKGSIDFFATYPGLYVPRTLEFRCDEAEQTPRFLAEELLALTKMDWNNTQFDRAEPVTIRVAREVGALLKYVEESASIEPQYKFYM
jgi:hypothetical protein